MKFVLAFIIVGAYSCGWAQVPKNDQHSPDPSRQNRDANDRPVPPTHVVIDQPYPTVTTKPESTEKNTKSQKPWFVEMLTKPDWIMVLITAAYVFFTGWILIVIKQQANSTQRTVDVLINSERAWVLVKPLMPNIGQPAIGELQGFSFEIKNRGKTVARLTGPYRARFDLIRQGQKLPDIPDYRVDKELFGDEPESPVHGAVLGPGQRYRRLSFPVFDVTLNGGTLAEINSNQAFLYFYASLTYFDFADKERENRFCYLYYPRSAEAPARWRIAGLKEYNKHT